MPHSDSETTLIIRDMTHTIFSALLAGVQRNRTMFLIALGNAASKPCGADIDNQSSQTRFSEV